MTIENIAIAIAIITSFGYMILGLLAYSSQNNEPDADKSWVLSPLWAFSRDPYTEAGKKLCSIGVYFFWVATVAMIVWIAVGGLN